MTKQKNATELFGFTSIYKQKVELKFSYDLTKNYLQYYRYFSYSVKL